ncbi:hypothetical protein BsWGS_22046 [Bradybaena similaris]
MSSNRQPEVIRAQLVSKAVLSPDETELYTLTQLAGFTVDQEVFKIILDLLKLNVTPVKIVQTLKSMCSSGKHSTSDTEAKSQDRSSVLLVPGVPKTSHKQGYSVQDSRDLTMQSDCGGRAGSQDRSSNLAHTSNSYSQDGSGYSVSSLGKFDKDSSSQLHSHLMSDSSYGRNEWRSHDGSRQSQKSAIQTDSYVSARQTSNSSADYDSNKNKDMIKKRTY